MFQEEPIPGGGNGIYEGKRHFTCELGLALFVLYDQLQADSRFGDVFEAPEKNEETDLNRPHVQLFSPIIVGPSSLGAQGTPSSDPTVEERLRPLGLEEGTVIIGYNGYKLNYS